MPEQRIPLSVATDQNGRTTLRAKIPDRPKAPAERIGYVLGTSMQAGVLVWAAIASRGQAVSIACWVVFGVIALGVITRAAR